MKHLSEKQCGSNAIIIKNEEIKHCLHSKFNQKYIQTTTIIIQTDNNAFQVSAIYTPPKYKAD